MAPAGVRQTDSALVSKVYFDDRIAARYDASSGDMFDPAVLGPAVDLLADRAAGGPALELGIGTGRVALPLSQRGIRVHGIDLSPAMVGLLRAKPGSEKIGVTIGDFASVQVGESFRLAYLVYNTITNLTSQDEQVRCFQNVAAHLEPGGCFAIEVFVPILQRLPPRRGLQDLPPQRDEAQLRRVRRRHADPLLPPLQVRGRQVRVVLGAIPVCLAVGARPHGTPRRAAAT